MTYQFSQMDDKILDFMGDNFLEMLAEIERSNGEAIYRYHDLKLVITKEKHPYDN